MISQINATKEFYNNFLKRLMNKVVVIWLMPNVVSNDYSERLQKAMIECNLFGLDIFFFFFNLETKTKIKKILSKHL